MSYELSVEATGETVGEARWAALRELERQIPGLDRETVRYQVVSEGERGLLGVGFAPAQVIAVATRPETADGLPEQADVSAEASLARELLARSAAAIGARAGR